MGIRIADALDSCVSLPRRRAVDDDVAGAHLDAADQFRVFRDGQFHVGAEMRLQLPARASRSASDIGKALVTSM
jgi:hypothetical protein